MARGTKRKAVADSEIKAKRARGETDLKGELQWSYHGDAKTAPYIQPLLKLTSSSLPGVKKAVGFDIDFTLIETKSGRKFATGAADWKWLYPCVPDKLRQLNKDGYRVVFFTNQVGIEKLKVKPEEIQRKVEAMISDLDIPAYCFVSTGQNHYRKPSTAVWDHFAEECNNDLQLDLSKCVYVGDAAGRPKDWAPGKVKDFSCSDRMFAANIGIDFKTPEEYFLDDGPAPFDWKSPDTSKIVSKKTGKKTYHQSTQEMIIMCGPPASGKSTFTKKYLIPNGYVHVNRDTLNTAAKCIKAAFEAVNAGKSVVIDNTNPGKAARADFLDIAKKEGIPVRCFKMSTAWELAKHLNFVRQTYTKSEVRRVPDVGYNMYKKNFEEPTKAEGYTTIETIDFDPEFVDARHEKIFRQWTSLI